MISVDDNDEILDQGQRSTNFNNTHDLIHVTIKPHTIAQPSESLTYRKYSNITSHNLNSYLEICDWTALLPSDTVFDLESELNCLSSYLQRAIEELASLKTVKPRKGSSP